jgi:hypothetical protein
VTLAPRRIADRTADHAADGAPDRPGVAAGWVTGAVGAWIFPFVLVLYLALADGGYDILVWGEIGVLVWWLLLLGALVAVLPVTSLDRRAWWVLAALTAFAAWTALGIGWSDSAERAVGELTRTLTYLGVFVLALGAARAGYAREALNGLAAGLALVGLIALLSRLHPAWFPPDAGTPFLGERNRLDYPLNYFNALSALLALAVTLAVAAGRSARTPAGRALATASLPALALALFYTLSRGGILAAVIGISAFLALTSDRRQTVRTLLIAGAGSALLILVADQALPALEGGHRDAAAHREGNVMLALVAAVCLAVGLAQRAIARREPRAWGGAWPRSSPPLRVRSVAALVAVAGVLILLVGGVTVLSDGGPALTAPELGLSEAEQRQPERLTRLSTRGRYQIWRSALDAAGTAPLHGIGPGSFEFWWAREGRLDKFFGSGHSLYFDTLAELGFIGLLLIGSVLVIAIVAGAARATREPAAQHLLAGAAAGCAVFAVSAGIEWIWEVAVLPVAFLVLAAIAVGHPGASNPGAAPRPQGRWRLALGGVSIAALVAIVLPLMSTAYVRASEDDVAASRLRSALEDARTAERLQPYAAAPKLQQAFVYERLGDFRRAARAARSATEAQSTDWRTWLVLSRIEARRGRSRASLHAYGKARSLNPRSRLFEPGT